MNTMDIYGGRLTRRDILPYSPLPLLAQPEGGGRGEISPFSPILGAYFRSELSSATNFY